MEPIAAPLYPIALSLEGRHCLLVGLGSVGLRKLSGLLPCAPASILALDTALPSPNALPLLDDSRIRFERRSCTPEDIAGKTLVFAATDNKQENARIAELCRAVGVLCNSVTTPENGSFNVLAVARKGCLVATISSDGASPALIRRWCAELEEWLVPRVRIAEVMRRLRPLVLRAEVNRRIFHDLADSPLQYCLNKSYMRDCKALFMEKLPPELHEHIAELLDDLP
ncbi:MAG: siroheme synthase [Candidatus Desulfovibrio kirbyi]|uniref:precorrin-2 dehydrogenase n=1 Tax=Candidatus Desulfovibrio kirbyi TaxID=2696086 RepID=A0A6L2R4R6_9BACT|nr:MAG: siroheme synthase [Candidatus Desulfovibrio kirbyi]